MKKKFDFDQPAYVPKAKEARRGKQTDRNKDIAILAVTMALVGVGVWWHWGSRMLAHYMNEKWPYLLGGPHS